LDTPVCGYSRMSDTVIFSVSHPYTWIRPMARWLDGSMAGSTARSMWLDGSMLTEDVFSLDALMPDSMPVLMPSSMRWLDALARCRLDAGSMAMQARCNHL
jgi:hypothetical protein